MEVLQEVVEQEIRASLLHTISIRPRLGVTVAATVTSLAEYSSGSEAAAGELMSHII